MSDNKQVLAERIHLRYEVKMCKLDFWPNSLSRKPLSSEFFIMWSPKYDVFVALSLSRPSGGCDTVCTVCFMNRCEIVDLINIPYCVRLKETFVLKKHTNLATAIGKDWLRITHVSIINNKVHCAIRVARYCCFGHKYLFSFTRDF